MAADEPAQVQRRQFSVAHHEPPPHQGVLRRDRSTKGERRHRIVQRPGEFQPVQVKHRQVRGHSGGDLANVRPIEHLGAADGGYLQSLPSRHGAGAVSHSLQQHGLAHLTDQAAAVV